MQACNSGDTTFLSSTSNFPEQPIVVKDSDLPSELYPDSLSGDEGEPRNDNQLQSNKSSLTGVVINILNTSIGGTVLALPYVVRQLGIVVGSLIFMLGAYLLCICSSLLQQTKNLSGHSNYVTIAKHCFGKKGSFMLSICLIISNLGSCIVFLTIFALVSQNILGFFFPTCSIHGDWDLAPFYCNTSTLIILGGLIVTPFTFLKNIGALRIIGFVKMLSVTIFAAITIGYCIYKIAMQSVSEVEFWPTFDQPVHRIGCISEVVLAYVFTVNQFSIYKSMSNPSDARFGKGVKISMTIIMMTFIVIGVSGYLIFGSGTDNVLRGFTINELGPVPFLLLNISFLLFTITTYPPSFFCPRNVLYMAIMSLVNRNQVVPEESSFGRQEVAGSKPQQIEFDSTAKSVYAAVVLLSNAAIVVLALVAPNINIIFGLIGSVAANALVFLFPPAFYLILSGKKAKRRLTAKLMFALGIVIGVAGSVCNMFKIFVA